jgi:glycosyltransferase involved in cell wall biosynthesis
LSSTVARSIFYYTDSELLGGAEESLFMLIDSLDRAAWAPELLLDASADAPLIARARDVGVPIRLITPMPLGLRGAVRVPAFMRALLRDRPSVFHAQLSWPLAAKYALAAAVLARVPAVLATVQLFTPYPIDRSNAAQLRALARGVGRYIAVSEGTKRQLVDQLGWPAEKIEVVYNAVRSERFAIPAPRELRAELTGGRDRPIVLTVARLDAQKDHRALLEAATALPEAVFVLAGEGPEREPLEAVARRLGLADRVRFLGRRTDIPELLAACDVFALPSLYEGSSLAILEAMAAGRSIVSTAIPGTDELLADGETGLLVPPGDTIALAGAIRRALADQELRTRLGARARETVQRDFTSAGMARHVTSLYHELLGTGEGNRNALLRLVDWRFLLRQAGQPRTANMARGPLRDAVALIADPTQPSAGAADLLVLSSPHLGALSAARSSLRPGGVLYAEWRVPRPWRAQHVYRALVTAGFEDIRLYWPGPRADRAATEFWLPLDSPAARRHVLTGRPPRGYRGRAVRLVWRVAEGIGSLAPIAVIARTERDQDADERWLLLTGGARSINKVVGLPFTDSRELPPRVVKFARVPEAEPFLQAEANVLKAIELEHPNVPGVPRVISVNRRAGALAVTESALYGTDLMTGLTTATFARYAANVTSWLVGLAQDAEPEPREQWWERLVAARLTDLERHFGPVVEPDLIERAAKLLQALPTVLPIVPEHRDCAPWNMIITATGEPALLDWESAELRGLPLLDLVYFLANAAFLLEGALETGATRATYARLLDPATQLGKIAADSISTYRSALGLSDAIVAPLRVLTWVVHSRSDYRHAALDAGGPPPLAALRSSPFLGLILEELGRP